MPKGKNSLRDHASSSWTKLLVSGLPNSLDKWPKALPVPAEVPSPSLCSEGQNMTLGRSEVGKSGANVSTAAKEREVDD